MFRKPEIMSPAGHWPQLEAAIEAGADAVYFGLTQFTARAKVGFVLEELPDAMRTLHRRGVKGFVTFNTLIFEDELAEAARTIAAIAEAGADAIIVQDPAILKLAREIAPDLELHASTQMSVTDAAGVRFAQSLGAARVTLARELSLAEIGAIRRESECDLEIFVHGALCVAYSGQCFSSEAWGGRSANRGQCAQACRLPYELIVDGRASPLGDARYLLSPGDLCTVDYIPQIVELGIAALKIEGRYKDAEYVALTTRAYRRAVDAAMESRRSPISALDKLQLEQVYSRGLGPHFLSGTNHQTVVRGRGPRHRGVLVGRVVRVVGNAVEIEPSEAADVAPIKAGDGLVFDAADWRSPQEPEEGGRVYETEAREGGRRELRFGNDAIDFSRIRAGDWVWRSHDPEVERIAKPYLAPGAALQKQPVDARVVAHEGEALAIEWRLASGESTTTTASEPLLRAKDRGLNEQVARGQLERLGNTAYSLRALTLEVAGVPFAPASLLNRLRREAVARLQDLQARGKTQRRSDPDAALESMLRPAAETRGIAPRLHLLVRTIEQLDAAIEAAPASLTLDYLDLYGLKPSVERVKAAGIVVRVASPRILKPGEDRIVQFLLKLETPILVRSTGLLEMLSGKAAQPLTGDFSLNAANSITARELLDRGLERIAPTHDLNAAQIAALANRVGGTAIEVIAYQHLPVFHTEHCVFCRFLSTGTSFKDCGRPCEKHVVSLRDSNGRAHPLAADIGCRNTVFGAEAQEASGWIELWRGAGIADFRLEFAHETSAEVERVTHAFQKTFDGLLSSAQLTEELRRIAPQGVTAGSLFVPLSQLTEAGAH